MKKYLNSPEQVLIALKLGKVVYEENASAHYKIVEGVICSFDENGCVLLNAGLDWYDGPFYVIEK